MKKGEMDGSYIRYSRDEKYIDPTYLKGRDNLGKAFEDRRIILN
jgi:hypothetical protein